MRSWKMNKYVLALDYDSEGWNLVDFDNHEELEEYILSGRTCGNPIRIFTELKLEIKESE